MIEQLTNCPSCGGTLNEVVTSTLGEGTRYIHSSPCIDIELDLAVIGDAIIQIDDEGDTE